MTTFAFTTDAAEPDEAITAHSVCTRIVLYEDGQAGTADFKLRMPLPTSPQVTKPAGSKLEIEAPRGGTETFLPGQIVGYISAATGSLSMVQEEY